MGYALFYENMLDCVLYARDVFLHDNGLILPDHASVYLAGCDLRLRDNESSHKLNKIAKNNKNKRSATPRNKSKSKNNNPDQKPSNYTTYLKEWTSPLYGRNYDLSAMNDIDNDSHLNATGTSEVMLIRYDELVTEPMEIMTMNFYTIPREKIDNRNNREDRIPIYRHFATDYQINIENFRKGRCEDTVVEAMAIWFDVSFYRVKLPEVFTEKFVYEALISPPMSAIRNESRIKFIDSRNLPGFGKLVEAQNSSSPSSNFNDQRQKTKLSTLLPDLPFTSKLSTAPVGWHSVAHPWNRSDKRISENQKFNKNIESMENDNHWCLTVFKLKSPFKISCYGTIFGEFCFSGVYENEREYEVELSTYYLDDFELEEMRHQRHVKSKTEKD